MWVDSIQLGANGGKGSLAQVREEICTFQYQSVGSTHNCWLIRFGVGLIVAPCPGKRGHLQATSVAWLDVLKFSIPSNLVYCYVTIVHRLSGQMVELVDAIYVQRVCCPANALALTSPHSQAARSFPSSSNTRSGQIVS